MAPGERRVKASAWCPFRESSLQRLRLCGGELIFCVQKISSRPWNRRSCSLLFARAPASAQGELDEIRWNLRIILVHHDPGARRIVAVEGEALGLVEERLSIRVEHATERGLWRTFTLRAVVDAPEEY